MSALTDLVALTDLPEGRVTVVERAGRRVALCRIQERVYAVEDRCSHDDGPLGDGVLDGHAIVCPRHGARFDVRTGEALRMPAAYPCQTYPVKIEGGRVLVRLDDDA